ncbi:AI-2E family transporter [Salinirubellus salinus]|uniref:AI-2E family transporter n=1 Tax=Salinirubellus salinus TaxID=1364945 RepID=A0A9E7R081_9EURY|nr:AI-2E family transporter [Salinirubellus salinus]UWM53286.1 AI-2E family transporter [Salinirubellus salinus]
MNEKRLVVAVFGVVIAVLLGYLAFTFVAALTVAVFVYYSTRRYYKFLRRFRLPARVRAMVTLASLAVPLLLLVSYTLVLLVVEARRFVENSDLVAVAADTAPWLGNVNDVPEFTVGGMIQAYRSGDLDPFIQFATENAEFLTSVVSGFFLNAFIVVIVVYYMLVDGERIKAWLLRFDDDAIVREYLEAADRELEAVLFGNLLNVIATALIAITVYHGYNAFAPDPAMVPYPTLAGALTGLASLVPVVGMKIVYLPLTGIAAIPVLMSGVNQAFLVYVLGFLVVTVVVVDTIPDIVLRPLLSGETTHVGLLMLAYTLGPVVLGFYGLFFAPILLVVTLTFANTALPRLLGAEPETKSTGEGLHPNQLKLDQF